MNRVKFVDHDPNYVYFECPGCKRHHVLPVGEGCKNKWNFNNNLERPTLHPSILATWDYGPNRIKNICHSYVTDGKIQFLGDCTHELSGKTIDLPDVENDDKY